MRAYVLSAIVLLSGCKDRNAPSGDARPDASAAASASPRKLPLSKVGGNCTNVCRKTLKCMNAYDDAEQSSCVSLCQDASPDVTHLSQLHSMDCERLVAAIKAANDGSSSPGGNVGAALGLKRSPKDATSTP